MSRKRLLLPIIAAILMAAIFLAGCTTPTPTPAPTATPTVPPAISAVPTPVSGNDRANIAFSYVEHSSGQVYYGIAPGPGELIYAFDVTVDSDRPIHTDGTWFTIEYRQNGTAGLKTYEPMTIVDYPATTIGNGSGPAKGTLLIALPAPGENATGPTPVYGKPMDEQTGPYKVYGKVYGAIRTT